MRRKDREVTDIAEIHRILKKGTVLQLALNNGMYPYLLPVNYGYRLKANGMPELFFHGSEEGEKHKVIAADPHVSFSVVCGNGILPPTGTAACTASFAYESVIGQGILSPVADADKEEMLTLILRQYGITAAEFSPEHLEKTKLYCITAEHITAKRRT